MNKIDLFTIGVYGSDSDVFFNKLTDNNIDTFCDIRRRRGVRGSEYSFVNSKRLQTRLKELNINYLHIIELSTPEEIREIQHKEDKKQNVSQRKRDSLSEKFVTAYNNQVLKNYDFNDLLNHFNTLNSKRVVLFCVEKNPLACHRSIIADYMRKNYSLRVTDL